jgi:hypothetical protein
VVAVVEIADLFEAGGFEAVGFVDDKQFCVPAVLGFGMDVGVDVTVPGISMAHETCWHARGRPWSICLMVAATVGVKNAVRLCWTPSGTGGSRPPFRADVV